MAEAFIAIMLIAIVVLLVIQQDKKQKEDDSSVTYAYISNILREVELNNSLRNEILNIQNSSLPVLWSAFNSSAPQTYGKITGKIPAYLNCESQVCATSDVCLLSQSSQNQEKAIYAESIMIGATIQKYDPKLLKIFCWKK
ncbi:MAG: hypothetical protein AABX79_00555 [Nanoarchaeota archaeon]